ncbi:uncharacterized protein TNCV_765371 [Trichonephila clavipes]|nr:uncharacterized protein TNCV_765371 [Trichonephila clavipes]
MLVPSTQWVLEGSGFESMIRQQQDWLRFRDQDPWSASIFVSKVADQTCHRCDSNSLTLPKETSLFFYKRSVAAVAEWYRYRTVACFVMGSSPVSLKTRRVGQRCTLNLSRAETSSHWCGVVVRRGGQAQVSSTSLDHGSKLRGPSPKSPRVAEQCDVNIQSINLQTIFLASIPFRQRSEKNCSNDK